jgi:hypothetical protein
MLRGVTLHATFPHGRIYAAKVFPRNRSAVLIRCPPYLFGMVAVIVLGAASRNYGGMPDRIFAPQESFFSAASKGVGGAGTALAWSLSGSFANPALLFSCRNGTAPVSRSLSVGYGRDSLFDRFIVPLGASYSRKREAAAVNLRVLSSSTGLDEYEAAATYCRRVLSRSDPKGPLDLGATLRYAYADWQERDFDSLATTRSYLMRTSGAKIRPDDTIGLSAPPGNGGFRENRIFLDAGLFIPGLASHVDFGLAVRNIGGVHWGRRSPDTLVKTDSTGARGDTLTLTTSRSYLSKERFYIGWVGGRYTTLNAGIDFKLGIPAGKVSLSFPVDFDIYGLFASSQKLEYGFRGGMQMHILQNYFVRIGVGRAPGTLQYDARTIKLVNDFSIGASLLPPGLPLAIDCYFSHWAWGLSAAIDY